MLTWLAAFFPIIGAIIAGAAAVLVALVAGGPTDALIVLAAIVVVQQVEGNVLYPVVVGPRLKLHPIVVLVSVAAGGTLAGISGAFLAVPVATVCGALLGYHRERRGQREDAAAVPPAAASSCRTGHGRDDVVLGAGGLQDDRGGGEEHGGGESAARCGPRRAGRRSGRWRARRAGAPHCSRLNRRVVAGQQAGLEQQVLGAGDQDDLLVLDRGVGVEVAGRRSSARSWRGGSGSSRSCSVTRRGRGPARRGRGRRSRPTSSLSQFFRAMPEGARSCTPGEEGRHARGEQQPVDDAPAGRDPAHEGQQLDDDDRDPRHRRRRPDDRLPGVLAGRAQRDAVNTSAASGSSASSVRAVGIMGTGS